MDDLPDTIEEVIVDPTHKGLMKVMFTTNEIGLTTVLAILRFMEKRMLGVIEVYIKTDTAFNLAELEKEEPRMIFIRDY